MSGKFAKSTEVSVERSRAEIENVLAKYGAEAFGYTIDGGVAKIAFRMSGRYYRFALNLPPRDRWDFNFYKQGPTTFRRADGVSTKLWEQECRSLWRALLLVIRAKLEASAIGITSIDDEFLAHTVLPDGSTVGQWAKPQLEEAYRIGAMPTTLLLDGPRS